ncbi:MAG: vitamin B12 dependent-methionine synthase activation domain-containing protein [Bacteroidota bacterium]
MVDMKVEQHTFTYAELNILKASMAEIMGYPSASLPHFLMKPIDVAFELGETLTGIEGGYRIIDSVCWNNDECTLVADGILLKPERIVYQQIKRASAVAVFVCTAGEAVAEKSKQCITEGDLLTGYVVDSFGSLVVETAMDRLQNILQDQLIAGGLKMTNRYSPGYCGWDVAEQKKVFGLLPEHCCGVELSSSCMMNPIKSVSGIIGIGRSVKFRPYACEICNATSCVYKHLHLKRQ